MNYPNSIKNLISHLTKLPTVGPRTAERYVFYLLNQNDEFLQKFAQAIAELKEKTTICRQCFSVSDNDPCSICTDEKRNKNIIAVIANTRDMLAVENAKVFKGRYHVLGGLIDPINNIEPKNLKIEELIKKINQDKPQEILLALNPTIEGETTSLYLIKRLKESKIKISRLARGLSIGSNLEYADEMTLANAIKFRN